MDYEYLSGEVMLTTEKAVLLKMGPDLFDERREVWIPRSVIEDGDSIVEGDTELAVAEWFCEKEGLA